MVTVRNDVGPGAEAARPGTGLVGLSERVRLARRDVPGAAPRAACSRSPPGSPRRCPGREDPGKIRSAAGRRRDAHPGRGEGDPGRRSRGSTWSPRPSDGREAVEGTLAHRPDVVLMDIRMPVLDGLAAAAEIRRLSPATGVVMLTTFGEDEYIARALKVGAGGFLLKSGDPRELLAGIHAVAGGAAYLSPTVAGAGHRRAEQPRLGTGGLGAGPGGGADAA